MVPAIRLDISHTHTKPLHTLVITQKTTLSLQIVQEELTLVWLLLITTVLTSFFIQRYHVQYIPPSGAAMILGMACGGIAKAAGLQAALRFSPAAFFYGLLPPIVFAAGFTLKKRDFFRNFGTISVFAVPGTFISALFFGFVTYGLVAIKVVKRSHLGTAPLIECLLYGALISATDPVATLSIFSDMDVPPVLYNLVFGESVLNDATAIVLFRTLEEFYETPLSWGTVPLIFWRFFVIATGSIVIGLGVASACAFILKRFQLAPGADSRQGGPAFNATIYEVALRLFEFAAFLSEMFVFAYLGLQVAAIRQGMDLGLMLTGVPLVVLSRALNIYPLAYLVNRGRRLPLPINLQHTLWACGLRGAVAYGLAVNLPNIGAESDEGIPAIESATLVIVLVSTLLFGGITGPMVQHFGLQGLDDMAVHALGYQDLHKSVSPSTAANAVREIAANNPDSAHTLWKQVDKAYLKPLFGGRSSGQPHLYALSTGNTEDAEVVEDVSTPHH
ncbi:MAG: CPA1 family transporter: sodium ion proton, partial [Trebouxia sp. A1-2]